MAVHHWLSFGAGRDLRYFWYYMLNIVYVIMNVYAELCTYDLCLSHYRANFPLWMHYMFFGECEDFCFGLKAYMFESTLCGRYHSFFCLQEICSKAFAADSYNDQERALQTGCRVTMKNGDTLTTPLQKWRATAPPESITPAVTEVDEATAQPPATRFAGIMEFLFDFLCACMVWRGLLGICYIPCMYYICTCTALYMPTTLGRN